MTSAKAAMLGAGSAAMPTIPHQHCLADGMAAAATAANAQMLAGKAQISPPVVALVSRDTMLGALGEGAFLQVLRAGPAPPVGLVTITPHLVRSLANALSGAKPRAHTGTPSRIESALAEMFAHRLLQQLGEKLTPNAGESALCAQPNRGAALNQHALQSRLPEGSYAAFALSVQLDKKDEDSTITCYYHLDFCNRIAAQSATAEPQNLGAEAQRWHQHMQNVALTAPIAARCIIDRFSLPTRAVTRLQSGDILPLPGLGLADITLELPHRSGRLAFGQGKLGASRRNKALQLLTLTEEATLTAPRLSAPSKTSTK